MFSNKLLEFRGILKISKNTRCYKHRQLLSKMFPSIDPTPIFSQVDKTKIEDDSSTVAGSLAYSLMMKHKLIQNASNGTYHYMPSTTRSLTKLIQIIDREMANIGAQKIIMPCLAPKRLWEKSDRWQVMGSELFKLVDRSGSHHCLSPTHEEAVTSIVASESPISHKRLPIKLYQIGKKFRDEMRPKHGLLRCREFEMKDLYTFDDTLDNATATFREVCQAYNNILTWLDVPFLIADASTGNMGGTKSSEFHLLSKVGEDVLFQCDSCGSTVNKELLLGNDNDGNDANIKCTHLECTGTLKELSGIEIAHAFVLDTKYSDAFGAKYIDGSGNKRSLVMGCYGIGVSRLLAATVEINSTKDGIKYCPLLAPYQICIIPQKEGYQCELTYKLSESLFDSLNDTTNLRGEVVIDDRLHISIGQRLNQAVAAGYPYAVVVGNKALDSTCPQYELVNTYKGTKEFLSLEALMQFAINLPTINIAL